MSHRNKYNSIFDSELYMRKIDFKQVDVFTSVPFKGNPVAVVMDAQGLSDKEMQAIANWTNLSETTFVLPPKNCEADYRVRIFTPANELSFAGHPTIGTAYALIEAGIIQVKAGCIIQECGAGLVHLFVNSTPNGITLSFELPKTTITPLTASQIDRLESILGCQIDRSLNPALVDVGACWIVAHTNDYSSVLTTQPDYSRLKQHDSEMHITGVCLYGEYHEQAGLNIEVRSFAPSCGVNEDPVCGSGNGCVASFMRYHSVKLPADGVIFSYQGRILGRDGKIQLMISDKQILVGGYAVTCISGQIRL